MIHYKHVCKHGIVVKQCRCPDKNKETTLVACPDDDRHNTYQLEGEGEGLDLL